MRPDGSTSIAEATHRLPLLLASLLHGSLTPSVTLTTATAFNVASEVLR